MHTQFPLKLVTLWLFNFLLGWLFCRPVGSFLPCDVCVWQPYTMSVSDEWKENTKKPHDKSDWKMMDNGWQSDGSAILTEVLSFVSSVVLSYDSREQFIFLRQICYEVLHWYVFLKHICRSSFEKMHVHFVPRNCNVCCIAQRKWAATDHAHPYISAGWMRHNR